MSQAFLSFCGDHTGLFSPLQKPSIVGQQLLLMASGAVVDSVGEIQTGISPGELERRFRPCWWHFACQFTLRSITIKITFTGYILPRYNITSKTYFDGDVYGLLNEHRYLRSQRDRRRR